jgi:hypothetical protein
MISNLLTNLRKHMRNGLVDASRQNKFDQRMAPLSPGAERQRRENVKAWGNAPGQAFKRSIQALKARNEGLQTSSQCPYILGKF